ncbi:hypothetical protein HDE_07602 [Halotydeus destructor]|nr:hypothetical protein HDE_07602 [Halotydeus destructor]
MWRNRNERDNAVKKKTFHGNLDTSHAPVSLCPSNKMAEDQGPVHWKLRALWFCLCVAGNCYQAYTLANAYLAYDVATQVKIDFPAEFDPPAASLCFALVTMFKLDIALDRFPNLITKMSKVKKVLAGLNDTAFKHAIAEMSFNDKVEISEFIYENMLVKEAFAMTYHQEDLFKACRIVRASDYTFVLTRCDQLYEITESFKSTVKCFTFKLKERQHYNYLTIQRMKLFPGMQSTIIMKDSIRNLTRDITAYFHLQDSYGREGYSRYLFLTPMDLFTMTYVTFDTELLAAPFDTDCQDYKLLGYFDRGDCFETCVNKQALDRMGKLAPGTNILLKDFADERLTAAETVINNAAVRKVVYDVNNDCDKYCSRPNCKEMYYIPQLMATNEFDFPCFLTLVEQQPRVSSTYFPKLGFVECVTDLFSTLGFWIGASGLTVFDFFWDIFFARKSKWAKGNSKLTLVQAMAIRKLQHDVKTLQESRAKERTSDGHGYTNTDSYSRLVTAGVSNSFSGRGNQTLSPMFRTNFFKL